LHAEMRMKAAKMGLSMICFSTPRQTVTRLR
jgi:hypothetical protein